MFFPIKSGIYAESPCYLKFHKISDVSGINKISVPFLQGCKGNYSNVEFRFALTQGQFASKNQMIGETVCDGVPFPLYSGISGKVKRIKQILLADGTSSPVMEIESTGSQSETACSPAKICDYASLCEALRIFSIISPDYYFDLIKAKATPKVLIVNCIDCDVFSEEQSRLFKENTAELFGAASKIAHLCGIKSICFVADRGSSLAVKGYEKLLESFKNIAVKFGEPKYPILPSRIIKAAYGVNIPILSTGANAGYLVLSCSEILNLLYALEKGTPCTATVITVSGNSAPISGNYRLPIGTTAETLLDVSMGNSRDISRTVFGGALNGNALYRFDVPIERNTVAVIFSNDKEKDSYTDNSQCYRCGKCVDTCPMGLFPVEIAKNFRAGRYSENIKLKIDSCIGCGCCSYICSGKVPLTQYISAAKGRIKHNG